VIDIAGCIESARDCSSLLPEQDEFRDDLKLVVFEYVFGTWYIHILLRK